MPGGDKWLSSSGEVASSADGNRLVAVASQHGIYTWQTMPSPVLTSTASADQVGLSWLVPSTQFTLQQTPSLQNPVWTDIAVQPIDSTTLIKVSLPRSPNPVFYRLALYVPSSK